ncbi:Eco57I restriction-modification methylase domain-containing protein [Haloimpatiens lingqiaonensis]|uniref:Eco57I restriction-modification methylase domain-containing protein n=1 Tax=Haloimpatiens lingqiaonensis TaxID=1380675 RepID=UPI0010FEFD53|nr:N-6 DNA methylase [Haloimpatiens lingqiaonensis]
MENLVKYVDEIYKIILMPIDILYKKQAVDYYRKKLNLGEKENFGDAYIKELNKKKISGVVYTPREIAQFIIEKTIDENNIINNPFLKILDPACGSGNILIPCFFYLKEIYSRNLSRINEKHNLNLKINDINEHILKNNLYGYDIDEEALKMLTIDLFYLTNITIKNIENKDFLMNPIDYKFGIIIGNPPYIGQKSIEKSYSKKLKEEYRDIYKDKGDISYCFFKKALDIIEAEGKVSFITSRYFLESPSGEELRKVLREICYIREIVDFYGIRPFKNTGVDPLIIFLQNKRIMDYEIKVIKPVQSVGKNKKRFYKSLFCNEDNFYKEFYLNKNLLSNKGWILRDSNEREIISKIEKKSFTNLNNICNSYQGIITGCDKAFVVTKEEIEQENIELNLVRPWIKSSNIKKFEINPCERYLIYSDFIHKEEDYPNAINHIGEFKHKLINRRECKKGIRNWYQLQWGRVPEVFQGKKIVFPYKSNKNRFSLDIGSFFSADIYCLTLKENVPFTYEYLLFLLNSKVYEFYFKTFAKKLGEDIYEYYPNNLMKLCIPTMTKFETEEELYEFFGFTEEEIKIIEGCEKSYEL